MNNTVCLNLKSIPRELRFLLEIVNAKNDDEFDINNIKWPIDINWNLFLELAMHHRLYPLLYPILKTADKEVIPSSILSNLYHTYKKNTFLMLQLSAVMEQVSKLFEQNQIRLLVLKGPILATDLYGDLSLRTCSDLDVLVPIHDLDKADELLENIGYIKDDYIETVLGDWKWRHHHFTYFHPEKKIKLEIHWRLNPGPGKDPSFNKLWERKRLSSYNTNKVYYLGREDLFLFLVSHGSRHGWSRLRWLVDIQQIVKQDIDWEDLYKLLNKYHYFHVGGQALILMNNLLQTVLTYQMKLMTSSRRSWQLAQDAIFYSENMVNLHTYPVPEDVERYHKRHLFSLLSLRKKFLFIISCLYPYPIDAKTLPLPKILHYLYFPLRPILCVWRKSRKYVFELEDQR